MCSRLRQARQALQQAQEQRSGAEAQQGQAVVEADFIGTHTGEFAGVAATGKDVHLPYCVVYNLDDDKITALRLYFPIDVLLKQIDRN